MKIRSALTRTLCQWLGAAMVLTMARWTRSADAPGQRIILCTTFPMYQITRNVVQGRAGVTVELLLPSQLGCPHDYSLTPRDMRKLAGAGILIVNGLGLEEFLGAPVKRANPRLVIIDSSAGIPDLLCHSGCGNHHGPDGQQHHAHGQDARHRHHAGVNPHLFTSPRQVARLAVNIAAGLSRLDPDGAALYSENAKVYAARMSVLADQFSALGRRLRNNRIVQPHGALDYLARDMGLEIVAVTQPHGQEPSAAEMLELVKVIREKQAGVIFAEPQYSDKVARTVANETDIPSAVFDPVASGPENAPLDYYETVMRRNLKMIEKTLGVR